MDSIAKNEVSGDLAQFELINQRGIIEALIFASNEPISPARLSRSAIHNY